jgi:hypothetical protein
MGREAVKDRPQSPPGPVRHDILKEIGKFRVWIAALKANGNEHSGNIN